jgi:uncharacterized alkaline shock family protein YloU
MARDDRSADDKTGGIPAASDDRPVVAEDVAATYVADAVLAVPGISGLHESSWRAFSGKMRPDHPAKGIVVRTVGPGVIEVDIHARVGWGVVIPDVAVQVREVVSRKMEGLLNLEVRKTTLYIDEIDAPPELT